MTDPSSASRLLSRWLAREDDARVVVTDATGEKRTTWREAVWAADRVAASLLHGEASLEGERVALLVAPGAPFVAAFFGVLRAGGAVVMLSHLHPAREMLYCCDDAGVRRVIASPGFAERAGELGRTVLTTDDLLANGTDTSAANASPDASVPASIPRESDAALQIYTSGTTNKPKGAVLTHANLGVQQELLGAAWGLRQDDVLLHVLPLHHIHGLGIAMLSTLGSGGGVRFLDFTTTSFDPRATWEAMGEVTVFMAVPSIHTRLMAAFDAADPATRARWTYHARRLRLVTSGSAALPVSLGDRWRSLIGSYPLERFGMTELGVAASNPLDPALRRAGTVGPPLPGVKTRVVGDDGRDAETGELWIAGPSVFAGYHGMPERNAEAFVVEGGERWFKTGDTVLREADGYLRILGRTSVDILKTGGYKVSALEIEEAVREHPAIAEVAVVGVPDPAWGDRVVACVVPREGQDEACQREALRAFLKERIAAYKVPREVVVMRELPRNALGKVLKPELVKKLG